MWFWDIHSKITIIYVNCDFSHSQDKVNNKIGILFLMNCKKWNWDEIVNWFWYNNIVTQFALNLFFQVMCHRACMSEQLFLPPFVLAAYIFSWHLPWCKGNTEEYTVVLFKEWTSLTGTPHVECEKIFIGQWLSQYQKICHVVHAHFCELLLWPVNFDVL